MRRSEAFPSKYLKAADLQGRKVRVVISHVEMQDVGDDTKPVLFFQGKERGLVLNVTNSNNIAAVYGDETDEWIGKELILFEVMVDYQGRSVPAIRVLVICHAGCDQHALSHLVRLIAGAREGERNNLTYWAACRAGEMAASGLLKADVAAAVIAEAAMRSGLPRPEAERTARSGIRRTGGLARA